MKLFLIALCFLGIVVCTYADKPKHAGVNPKHQGGARPTGTVVKGQDRDTFKKLQAILKSIDHLNGTSPRPAGERAEKETDK